MRCWCMPGKALSVNLSKLLNVEVRCEEFSRWWCWLVDVRG